MYISSQNMIPIPSEQLEQVEKETHVKLPEAYIRFLSQYGQGTYRGWLNVQLPDPGVLQPFVEYDLWEHDELSPITQLQIKECVSIGTTIDGDFLAIHPNVDGIVWLPRHSDEITVKLSGDSDYTVTLDRIYQGAHGNSNTESTYFEPWNDSRKHVFFRFTPGVEYPALPDLGKQCKERYKPDLLIENEYTCKLFIHSLGGFLRLNYANGREIAVQYEADQQNLFEEISSFLLQNHCEIWE